MYSDGIGKFEPRRPMGPPALGTGVAAVVPPEFSGRMSCERLREWVRGAQPGALLAYARGYALGPFCAEALRDLVLALHEQEYLSPHLMRGGEGELLYVVRRWARPVLPGAVLAGAGARP